MYQIIAHWEVAGFTTMHYFGDDLNDSIKIFDDLIQDSFDCNIELIELIPFQSPDGEVLYNNYQDNQHIKMIKTYSN